MSVSGPEGGSAQSILVVTHLFPSHDGEHRGPWVVEQVDALRASMNRERPVLLADGHGSIRGAAIWSSRDVPVDAHHGRGRPLGPARFLDAI